ncbi:MAG: TIGR04255 family protein [Burkholderiales bacterium]|nr:TIGR04255 family protein [Burkholderiales bacterium]
MTNTALGTWRRPPLAYVVAELVISPYYSMAAKVPGLQDRLRSAFPRTIEAKELVIDGAKPSAQPLWQLMSVDQKHGVQLGTRSISLHATSYVQSSDFLGRWAEVLDAIQAADLGAFVERAGLRYVDLIVPAEGRSPADYLAPSLQGITPEGGRSTGSMWAAAFQFAGSLVNLRAAAPTPQGLLLPPDFSALPLNKPAVMLDAEKHLRDEATIGFVDTDCLKEIGKVFDAGELLGAYTEMQKLTSKTFKAALSDIARGEWM